MVNMSVKFDEEAHIGLVYIVFTSLYPYMSIMTLTFWHLTSKINRVLTMGNMSAKFDEESHKV